jgi:hypothetical protein
LIAPRGKEEQVKNGNRTIILMHHWHRRVDPPKEKFIS